MKKNRKNNWRIQNVFNASQTMRFTKFNFVRCFNSTVNLGIFGVLRSEVLDILCCTKRKHHFYLPKQKLKNKKIFLVVVVSKGFPGQCGWCTDRSNKISEFMLCLWSQETPNFVWLIPNSFRLATRSINFTFLWFVRHICGDRSSSCTSPCQQIR